MTYTLTQYSFIIRDADNAFIPADEANTDYQTYLSWLAEGNTPNPYVPSPPVIPQQVPMWAVRTVLQNDGLFDEAQSLIDTSSDNALKNSWEYANFWGPILLE